VQKTEGKRRSVPRRKAHGKKDGSKWRRCPTHVDVEERRNNNNVEEGKER